MTIKPLKLGMPPVTAQNIGPSGQFVVFCTPALQSWLSIDYHISMIQTEAQLGVKGIARGHLIRPGDAYLAKVRSKLASDFLRDHPLATDLFFIDDDVSWPPEKVLEFLERPEDVVAGIYPKKSDDLDFPLELAIDGSTGDLVPSHDGKLLMATMVPTGFLRIKRHVVQKIADASTFFHDNESDGSRPKFWNIFKMGMSEDGSWWGEDYAFCQEWRGMGGTIWVDPNMTMTHRGTKKWQTSLADHLEQFRKRGKQVVEQRRQSNGAPTHPADSGHPAYVAALAATGQASKSNGAAEAV
jgi:hypothetical protein